MGSVELGAGKLKAVELGAVELGTVELRTGKLGELHSVMLGVRSSNRIGLSGNVSLNRE